MSCWCAHPDSSHIEPSLGGLTGFWGCHECFVADVLAWQHMVPVAPKPLTLESLRPYVEAVRASIAHELAPNRPLRDVLVGQRSDVTFFSAWERNKEALIALLDAIDIAMPVEQHAR